MENQNQKPKRTVNVSPDKREFMLLRETLKILFIIGITSLVWSGILMYWTSEQKQNYEKQISKSEQVNKQLISKSEKPIVVSKKKEINYRDLCVVIKTSKDIKKYFVSYKKFYSKDKFDVVIKQISFKEYMLLSEKDTLTNVYFLNK